MKNIIILAYQEYNCANHRDLWNCMAEDENNFVIVMNISADQVVSRIKHKEYRIKESQEPPLQIKNNLFVGRALYPIREELVPELFFRNYARKFWRYIDKNFPQLSRENLTVLAYDALWIKILYGTRPSVNFSYFLTDEVRYNARDNSIRKKNYKLDLYACKNSDVVFTMSKKLAESRREICRKVCFIGNGADIAFARQDIAVNKIEKSVAFVGNFRNWIDNDLLENLIRNRPDINFYIVGFVEDNMKEFLRNLLSSYINVYYHGPFSKDNIKTAYRLFNIIIIPYKQNDFIKSSRPIKIVESVMCGTPVISVPVDGYIPSEIIRFATSVNEFSQEIDYLFNLGGVKQVADYEDFCIKNSWQYLAKVMIKHM